MKLAEALILRADLNKKAEQLNARIRKVAKVQEGDTPQEDPAVLQKELHAVLDQLQTLIIQINTRNIKVFFDKKENLMQALARRDILSRRIGFLRGIKEAGMTSQTYYSKSEIKNVSTINVKKIQKDLDKLSKTFRELDTKIQALNWKHDL